MSLSEAQHLVAVAMTRLAAAVAAPDPVSARLRLGRAQLAAKAVRESRHRWAEARVEQSLERVRVLFAARGWL
jgi:hypothetical protein